MGHWLLGCVLWKWCFGSSTDFLVYVYFKVIFNLHKKKYIRSKVESNFNTNILT